MLFWSKLRFLIEAKNTDGSLVRDLGGAPRCERSGLKRVPESARTVQVTAAPPRGRRREKQLPPPSDSPARRSRFWSCGVHRKKPAMLGNRGLTERLSITA